MDLKEQLQQTIGSAYLIQRELGGGGMSRVFVAEETAFGRRVVVKLLSPELVAGVNVDRFKREIQVAAKLQHPHIVPVLTAGESGGLPYYTMPFVDGESLRARLGRGGTLALNEAVSILRDVARALDYAHAHGIVHRDIKPDNVLLSHGTATVADFGIAKAISAAKTREGTSALTQIGVSIGTPMYMSPEQAAGDPDIDHRADIYAFGCMAYEMIGGRPPFEAKTPQRMLAAHMSERPRSLAELRPDVTRSLTDLVMRCLEKEPGARPQAAGELLPILESAVSSDTHGAAPAALGGRGMLAKTLVAYAVAFIAVVWIARWSVDTIGLPIWVTPVAVLVMAIGLAAILLTGYVQSTARRVYTATPTYTPGGTKAATHGTMATFAVKASPYMSWSRTRRWGLMTVGAFVLLIAAAFVTRSMGVGPFATLLTAGQLKQGEPVIVADLTLPAGSDSTLSRVLADAIKTDLEQSRTISVLPDAEVAKTLVDMQQRNVRLLLPVAREVAQRRHLKAIVDGSLSPIGSGFLVKLTVLTADSLRPLASFTGAADTPSQLIGVVGDLTRKLRGKMGESLKSVAASPPLLEATTTSLPALRKYSEGRRLLSLNFDMAGYFRLTEEAIALDSNFAMAYARLAIELTNQNIRQADVARYAAKAYSLRNKLSDRDRVTVSFIYFRNGPVETRDPTMAERYLDSIVTTMAGTSQAQIGLVFDGVRNSTFGRFEKADSLYRAAFSMDSTYSRALNNLYNGQRALGQRAAAESTFHELERRFPGGVAANAKVPYLVGQGDLRGAVAAGTVAYDTVPGDAFRRATLAVQLSTLAELRGRMGEAAVWSAREEAARTEERVAGAPLFNAALAAQRMVLAYGDSAAALRVLTTALAKTPIESIDLLDRPYLELGRAFVLTGKVDRARAFLAGLQRQYKENDPENGYRVHWLRAEIALAEHRYDDARRDIPPDLPSRCGRCLIIDQAAAYDGSGKRDSAIMYYEMIGNSIGRTGIYVPLTFRRLGELHASKGDTPNAIKWYQRFVDAWKEADPRLQPQVADVRQRLVRLKEQEGKAR